MCVLAVLAGFFSVLMIENMDQNMKVDDPAGLCSIFGVAGILGLLAVGISSTEGGLAHGGGILLLAVQLLADIWAFAFAGAETALVFWLLKKAGRLRLTAAEEIEGADISEYGIMSVYHDFAMNIDTTDWSDAYLEAQTDGRREEVELHKLYVYPPIEEARQPLTKIEIIARKEKLENLKAALNDIGITGMTVFPVTGCGVQKGYNEFYRGVPVAVQLRAKIRVEVVVAKVPVDEVVNTVRRVLYTGHVGDGKIFIYTLDDVVRVRTGESGYDAMQGASSE